MKISKAQISEARAKLQAAPAKEDVGSVRAAILQMRSELMAALIEKNWSFSELRDWLAAQGIEVSLAALQRYLVGVRAAKKAAAKVAGAPSNREAPAQPAEAARISEPAGTPEAAARAIPPMPKPVPPMPRPQSTALRATDPSVPRATSFPVRRDRDII